MKDTITLVQRYININSKCLRIRAWTKNLNNKSSKAELKRVLEGAETLRDSIYNELDEKIVSVSIPDIKTIIEWLEKESIKFDSINTGNINIDEPAYYSYIACQRYIKELEEEINRRLVLDISLTFVII